MKEGSRRSTGARTSQQSETEQGNIIFREVKSPKRGSLFPTLSTSTKLIALALIPGTIHQKKLHRRTVLALKMRLGLTEYRVSSKATKPFETDEEEGDDVQAMIDQEYTQPNGSQVPHSAEPDIRILHPTPYAPHPSSTFEYGYYPSHHHSSTGNTLWLMPNALITQHFETYLRGPISPSYTCSNYNAPKYRSRDYKIQLTIVLHLYMRTMEGSFLPERLMAYVAHRIVRRVVYRVSRSWLLGKMMDAGRLGWCVGLWGGRGGSGCGCGCGCGGLGMLFMSRGIFVIRVYCRGGFVLYR